jgi:hypothetical protein
MATIFHPFCFKSNFFFLSRSLDLLMLFKLHIFSSCLLTLPAAIALGDFLLNDSPLDSSLAGTAL